ncbi:MAG: leucine--tRNA ligase [Deltaproteobacteria bacterium RIFCSPHIGHO2_02_FULL_44_16]|nr:MAG: leucine--tRNA ligase [Deltaproteobacteria bacterium RIFCSPHIGHO2_02_FULL_44_16]
MTEKYHPEIIEPKWQKTWEEARLFEVNENKKQEKFYVVEMLPYPSGRIHMGHVRNYSIGDVASRYYRMKGKAVLHPMGWDAFGLPAENAAIKRGIPPASWTYDNIAYMRSQLKALGFSYDWRREFATCDPEYYRWEQLLFLKMFEKGWAYQKTSTVNWCPGCQTVLANEQVVAGFCWQCDARVEQKSMTQWYFRLTDYAEELLEDLEKLQGWPERVRNMQREWIGKSKGARVDFAVKEKHLRLSVFTTRPDTLFGVTFLSLAPEHPLLADLIEGTKYEKEVKAFQEASAKIDHQARLEDTYEKNGIFTGAYCLHPVTGEEIPIYVANFVLMEYGTGAVMAVPAHDQRDFEFAKKYNLPLKIVIQPKERELSISKMKEAYTGEGILHHSGEFSGLFSSDAMDHITAHLQSIGFGGPKTHFKIRDWGVSRQRYWGTPIPIIHCSECGAIAVPEKDLPVTLPKEVIFSGKGGSPLERVESFVKTICPKCSQPAKRETDTMDTFVESSWYLFRYTSPHCNQGPFETNKVHYWLPVDHYIGGVEHAVMHLIYVRYFTKVLRDLGYFKLDEPVTNLLTQGMVLLGGTKMSKSRGNIVDPDEMIQRYGADTCRLFTLFAAPPEKDLEWSDAGIEGSYRFLQKVWRFVHEWREKRPKEIIHKELTQWQHKTIKRVTHDIERWHLNTAIAALMEYVHVLTKYPLDEVSPEAVETLLLLLSPFAPHMCDEIWQRFGKKEFLMQVPWPTYDEEALLTDEIQIIIQVNGKLRDRIRVPADADEDHVKAMAFASEKVSPYIKENPKRVIYIPKKLMNIVTDV